MAGKKPNTKAILLIAAVVAIALSLSFYGVHKAGSRESEESAFNETTSGISKNPATNSAQADDSLSAALSARAQSANDSEAEQQQKELQESPQEIPDEDEPGDLTISGAVLDDAGQLVQGAIVMAQAAAATGQQNAAPVARIGGLSRTTDRLGSFEFINLVEGEYELTAAKGEEYFPASLKVRAGMANAELILQRFRVIRVHGTISDDLGIPLDAVTVRTLGTHFNVQSDENGRYDTQTAPMRAGSPPVLEFNREGFQETRRRIEAALNSDLGEVQLDVQMEPDTDHPKVTVAGQVLGPLGESVPGVSVRLKSFQATQGYSASTDGSGEFSIPLVDEGEGYRLNVLSSEDYEAYESEIFSLGPQDAYFEIELDSAKSSSLSGTVTDLTGRPLSGFHLWLRGIGTSAQSPLLVQTDAAGRFRVEKLRAGEIRLESRSQPMLSASNIVLKPGVPKEVEVPLDWGADWLMGRVVDIKGEPVAGASIVVRWKELFGAIVSESRRDLRSDLGGNFSVSNLGADSYSLTVQAPGYQTFQGQHQLNGGGEELNIKLPPIGVTGGTGNG